MSHTLVFTVVSQGEIELTDEEFEEYQTDPDIYWDGDYWYDLDTVERTIEEV